MRNLPFIFSYINNILIVSPSEEAHENNLKQIFERLKKYSIVINPSDYVFGECSISFLGHLIDSYKVIAKTKFFTEALIVFRNH